jgi:hypothetical protein
MALCVFLLHIVHFNVIRLILKLSRRATLAKIFLIKTLMKNVHIMKRGKKAALLLPSKVLSEIKQAPLNPA